MEHPTHRDTARNDRTVVVPGRSRHTEEAPLVVLGPGGRFAGEYRDAAPAGPRPTAPACPGVIPGGVSRVIGGLAGALSISRRDAELEAEQTRNHRAEALGLIVACERGLIGQEDRLVGVHRALRRAAGTRGKEMVGLGKPGSAGVMRDARGRVRLIGQPASGKVGNHEPDTQTTQDPAAHPRLADSAWLFADDAGVGGRDRRQQSHRVRTRRSTDQEGRPDPRSEQGTLFIDR